MTQCRPKRLPKGPVEDCPAYGFAWMGYYTTKVLSVHQPGSVRGPVSRKSLPASYAGVHIEAREAIQYYSTWSVSIPMARVEPKARATATVSKGFSTSLPRYLVFLLVTQKYHLNLVAQKYHLGLVTQKYHLKFASLIQHTNEDQLFSMGAA
jgi:hypothetical protein